MRTCLHNSPQAAAHVVALVLIADGYVGPSEERTLEKLDIGRELGIEPAEFTRIARTLLEDRSTANPPPPMAGYVDRAMLDARLAEIDDPALRNKTIRLCLAVASADDYLAANEIATLRAILAAWTPQPRPAAIERNVPSRIQPRAALTTCDARA